MQRTIRDIIKHGPKTSDELLLKRLTKLHPDEAPQKVAAILEKVKRITQDIER